MTTVTTIYLVERTTTQTNYSVVLSAWTDEEKAIAECARLKEEDFKFRNREAFETSALIDETIKKMFPSGVSATTTCKVLAAAGIKRKPIEMDGPYTWNWYPTELVDTDDDDEEDDE